jgi:hypothetical protein
MHKLLPAGKDRMPDQQAAAEAATITAVTWPTARTLRGLSPRDTR